MYFHYYTTTPDETETCRAVVEGHEIGVVQPGTARRVALMAVFVYVYQVTKV
jgi:hypothetical protein